MLDMLTRCSEIFVYGGNNDTLIHGTTNPSQATDITQSGFNGVYVLSVPGFVWHKSNDTSAAPRTGHTCEVAGNRQMISVGGINPRFGLDGGLNNTDTSPNGLGVFDMTMLAWTNVYDASAAAYTPAEAIKTWYNLS